MMYNNVYTAVQPQTPAYAINRPIYTQQAGIKGRPVASIEEARASIIDFDGSIFYFPDLANKRIYTKQINLDGTANLLVYELKEIVEEQDKYITREEFEAALNQLRGFTTAQSISAPTEEPKVKPVLNF